MLDALGIEFRALLGDADGAQKIDNEPMPGRGRDRRDHAPPASRTRRGKSFDVASPSRLRAGDRFDRGRMGDAQPAGDIGRAAPPRRSPGRSSISST